MRSRLWTKKVAVVLLACLFLLAVAFTAVGILVISLSAATTIALAVIQAVTVMIALFIPLSRKDEARRKMQTAMSQYVMLQGLNAHSSVKNRVINTMRELAPDARLRHEEIAEYLESTDVGERFAALACVQWQWRNDKAYDVMNFRLMKTPKELPGPSKHPNSKYFPQLLEVLCHSWDQFQNYHATVAMWSMANSLEAKDKQELFKRVLDQNAGAPSQTCKEWGEFKQYLNSANR